MPGLREATVFPGRGDVVVETEQRLLRVLSAQPWATRSVVRCRTSGAVAVTGMGVQMEPIGIVRSPREQVRDDEWGGTESQIVLDERFGSDALDGVEQFSHVEILFFFDRVDSGKIVTGARHPRNNRDWPAVGIFAQRGKARPNRIGSTIVRVVRREGRVLHVAELDAVDGTPVLDIKPVMQEFLPREEVRQPPWSSELMRRYWERGE